MLQLCGQLFNSYHGKPDRQIQGRERSCALPALSEFFPGWLRSPSYAPADLPEGWLSTLEAQAIPYTCAAVTNGPILEIGSWIGRSTCAIAYGLRDRVNAGGQLPRFDVVDHGLTGAAEAREKLQWEPLTGPFADHHAKVLFAHGGAIGTLKQNLVDRDLARASTI